jgi:hypothetical protein
VLVEELDELGKVGKRTGQPVDFVDDHDVDSFRPGWTVQGSAGEPTIVEMRGYELPTFMGLAFDVGLTCLSLCIEGVEGEVEIMLGRFAGVDRAALRLWRRGLLHEAPPRLARAADRS